MALTPENRSMRERNMYFNAKRVEAFEEIRGETILVDDVDATGKPMKRALSVPDDIRDFAYLGFDTLVDIVNRHKELEE